MPFFFPSLLTGFLCWLSPPPPCREKSVGAGEPGLVSDPRRCCQAVSHDTWQGQSLLRRHGRPGESAVAKAWFIAGKPFIIMVFSLQVAAVKRRCLGEEDEEEEQEEKVAPLAGSSHWDCFSKASRNHTTSPHHREWTGPGTEDGPRGPSPQVSPPSPFPSSPLASPFRRFEGPHRRPAQAAPPASPASTRRRCGFAEGSRALR